MLIYETTIVWLVSEPANKPGSVVDSHLSGMFVTKHLKRSTRALHAGHIYEVFTTS